MFSRILVLLATLQWSPRSIVVLIVMILAPGGLLLAPMFYRWFKSEQRTRDLAAAATPSADAFAQVSLK